MNNINITGNIVADATIRGTDDKKVANFTVAVRGRGEHTDFIRCTVFGKSVDYVEKYAKKGSKAEVSGSLHIGSYEKDGAKVSTAEIYVREVNLTAKAPAKAEDAPANDFAPVEDEDNELPFN
jgi:single-strand DNA-binding protein